ncbi:HSP20-like chaperone, partial [Mycena olivaceomarginata]
RAEIFDDPDHPNIEATFEVPGVNSSDIYIFVQGTILVIQGHRVPRHRRDIKCSHPRGLSIRRTGVAVEEFHYGKFYRAIRLPVGTAAESIRAGLSDGLLTISWPRQSTHQLISPLGTPD